MSLNPNTRALVHEMLDCGVLALRDVERGEEPFLYSSGNKGPGYAMVKGLVAQRRLLRALVRELAIAIHEAAVGIEYVAGNATGGMVPAWILAEELTELSGKEVPYFYVRGSRKVGGHSEQITGDDLNDFFTPGRRGIVMEELVNFAETTVNSALVQREAGYEVNHGATILFYDHPVAAVRLASSSMELFHLITMKELLDEAEETGVFESRLIADYRRFLADPPAWQRAHGLEPVVA
ncbi:MAG TPA: hypothetical protein VEA36_02275 [Candidatus Paceibacterota bacterium]|nr:hypothetical protein [Candidatus Paceibacterota bacterium]